MCIHLTYKMKIAKTKYNILVNVEIKCRTKER